jgi:hypothetical protein
MSQATLDEDRAITDIYLYNRVSLLSSDSSPPIWLLFEVYPRNIRHRQIVLSRLDPALT